MPQSRNTKNKKGRKAKNTANNNAKTGAGKTERAEPLCVGMDCHAGKIVVVRQFDGGEALPAQRFRDEDVLVGWLEGQRRRAGRIVRCYGAGPTGYGLLRKLRAIGLWRIQTGRATMERLGLAAARTRGPQGLLPGSFRRQRTAKRGQCTQGNEAKRDDSGREEAPEVFPGRSD